MEVNSKKDLKKKVIVRNVNIDRWILVYRVVDERI